MANIPLALLLSILCAHGAAQHQYLVGPHAQDADLDCAMRNFTYGYALAVIPARVPLLSVFDALRLAEDCNFTRPGEVAPPQPFYISHAWGEGVVLKSLPLPVSTAVWFVDSLHGNDSYACTLSAPCATIYCALNRSRSAGGGGTIVLRDAAPHVLHASIQLGAQDGGLSIAAYPKEAPQILGGVPLSPLSWARIGPSPNASSNGTVWAASLASQGLSCMPFNALFLDGRRAVRARYPNGNPETDQVPIGYTRAESWNAPFSSKTTVVQTNPLLGTPTRAACPPNACTEGGPSGYGPPWAIFCCFFWGVNGSVENFTTGGFWGVHPGPPGGATYHSPGGFIAGPDLRGRLADWATPTDAIVHAFHGSYWGDWAFTVASVNASSGEVSFAAGGWQEARGAGAGDYLYVENVREELDAPGEWFVDGSSGGTLYYCANGTEPPPASGWVAGQLESLFSLEGSPDAPVTDVVLAGITFAYTEPTFLNPFTAPSGGDWSFHDGGAVRFSGTSNCSVTGSYFVNIGGNGVMLSGWNRGASITDTEFAWMGEHAIVSGGLSGDQFDNTLPGALYGANPLISGVLAHELGVFVKQTGFYYHAMTANASVLGNVFFNGPRAGININDGFAGGHEISRNIAFNLVRETSDHGPFNSWDRNTYMWAKDTVDTLPIRLDRNLFMCNYHCTLPIDNDDGSNSYIVTNNWLLWGGTKSLMGYNKHFINNTFVYVDYTPVTYAQKQLGLGYRPSSGDDPEPPFETKPGRCHCSEANGAFSALGLQDQWWNNTCIASSGSNFYKLNTCNDSAPLNGVIPFPIKANRFYSNSSYEMRCNASSWDFAQAQARGIDLGSTLSSLPSTSELVAMGHDVLQF